MQKQPQPAAKPLYWTRTEFLFYCHFKIKIPIYHNEKILAELFEDLKRIDKTYNSFQEDSYFDKINKNAGTWIDVDVTTIELLKKASEVAEFLDGNYDISIMPLLRLLGIFDEGKKNPAEKEITEILKYVNYRNIQIENSKVKILENMELTTGSFLKSFAVDYIVDKLQHTYKITDALINAGGSTIYALNDESHPYWNVNIQEPNPLKNLWSTIKLSNKCINTSAQNIPNTDIGVHIFNPKSGKPAQNKQTVVITDNACLGDMLSTGLHCVDTDIVPVLEKIEQKYKAVSVVFDAKENVIESSDFNSYKL